MFPIGIEQIQKEIYYEWFNNVNFRNPVSSFRICIWTYSWIFNCT